jgi:hypothetical protein
MGFNSGFKGLNRRLCGPQRRFGRFGEQSLDSVANRTADCSAHSLITLPVTLSRCTIIRAGFGDGCVRWMQIARESVFFYTCNSKVRLKDSVNVPSVSSEICRLHWTFCRPSRHVCFECPDLCSFLEYPLWHHVKKTVEAEAKQSLYRPGHALRSPRGWGSQISWQSAHKGGKVVSPTHRLLYPPPPGNIPDTHFWVKKTVVYLIHEVSSH